MCTHFLKRSKSMLREVDWMRKNSLLFSSFFLLRAFISFDMAEYFKVGARSKYLLFGSNAVKNKL